MLDYTLRMIRAGIHSLETAHEGSIGFLSYPVQDANSCVFPDLSDSRTYKDGLYPVNLTEEEEFTSVAPTAFLSLQQTRLADFRDHMVIVSEHVQRKPLGQTGMRVLHPFIAIAEVNPNWKSAFIDAHPYLAGVLNYDFEGREALHEMGRDPTKPIVVMKNLCYDVIRDSQTFDGENLGHFYEHIQNIGGVQLKFAAIYDGYGTNGGPLMMTMPLNSEGIYPKGRRRAQIRSIYVWSHPRSSGSVMQYWKYNGLNGVHLFNSLGGHPRDSEMGRFIRWVGQVELDPTNPELFVHAEDQIRFHGMYGDL